ncbi:hypothetical protein [uncultured Cohaesibacter sp.]|uniref:hypothetical protein n=1 Tax=uncultured Cohaesibacter sp. TaxID=1002546 RepID=UPI002AA80598|nr:hypothetical protein [uncultured Cohaesibacter sp.]
MEISITDQYIAIDGNKKSERFSLAHIRKVNKYEVKTRIRNKDFYVWKKRLKIFLIFIICSLLIGYVLSEIYENHNLFGFSKYISAFLSILAIYYATFRRPKRLLKYDVFFAEFVSGENEVFGVNSLSRAAIDEFALKISEAMKGELKEYYNINIDKSINAKNAVVETLNANEGGKINFYEGVDVREELEKKE